MKNQQPLVSVLLLAMNHEKFIAQAVHSILNQTYKNFEVVFLDNNSKDKTFEIANDFFLNSAFRKSAFRFVSITLQYAGFWIVDLLKVWPSEQTSAKKINRKTGIFNEFKFILKKDDLRINAKIIRKLQAYCKS